MRDLECAIKLGCWFSIGPAKLTSQKGRALAERMPRESVLTESDGPFAQMNVEAVMPWQVDKAVEELSLIWSLPSEEVGKHIHQNLKHLVAKYNS